MLPQLFARRYLFSSQSRSVVNLISGLSVAAVAMPVAAMIILLSVFNGFESLVKSMYSAFDADGNAVYTYVRRYARFADAEVPAGTVSLTGILQYDAAGDGRYILKLRDENDCTH